MRALRVIGLAEDGAVICETETTGDGEKPERFTLKSDDRLRAAARGDLARLGQIEIELESQMRPREIQSRIRAGASVEEVAAAANMPAEKVDRFAYPVLLERSRTAELAQRAHPIRDDGPDVQTLGEVVATTFAQRGQDYSTVTWDSWRGDDGKWVVQLRWQAGRSDNRAHWTFHPGAHGGTVTVIDELAADLIDPTAGKPLRTVRPVTPLAEQALQLDEPARQEPRRHEPAGRQEPPHQEQPRNEPAALQEPQRYEPQRYETPRDETPRYEAPRQEPLQPEPPRQEPQRQEPAARHEPQRQEPAARHEPQRFDEPPAPAEPAAQHEPEPAADEPVEPAAKATGTTGTAEPAPARRGGRNNRPIVPSWEDVLLGVRSNPNR